MRRRTLALVLAACAALLVVYASNAAAPSALPSIAPSVTPAVAASSPTALAATSTPGPIPPGYRVKVPRLAIDLPIAEGDVQRDIDRQKTPEGYAFHLPGTSIPGTPGNAYLYSHARIGMFLALWNAEVGDDVIVTTPDGRTLRYVVTQVMPAVPPDDVSVAQETPDERLTLQTSTGPVPQDPRSVVIAKPAS
ncbi:MAG: sortase [Chloroflexota bacterium]|nr:sortase [Chloroflexota bacterium]